MTWCRCRAWPCASLRHRRWHLEVCVWISAGDRVKQAVCRFTEATVASWLSPLNLRVMHQKFKSQFHDPRWLISGSFSALLCKGYCSTLRPIHPPANGSDDPDSACLWELMFLWGVFSLKWPKRNLSLLSQSNSSIVCFAQRRCQHTSLIKVWGCSLFCWR